MCRLAWGCVSKHLFTDHAIQLEVGLPWGLTEYRLSSVGPPNDSFASVLALVCASVRYRVVELNITAADVVGP